MNISIPPLMALLYGLLVIGGGALGYKQAGSQVSLISGMSSGLLLLVSAYLLFGKHPAGPLCSAVVTIFLIVVFSIRLAKTRKFMPAGLMIIAGVINLISLWTLFSAV